MSKHLNLYVYYHENITREVPTTKHSVHISIKSNNNTMIVQNKEEPLKKKRKRNTVVCLPCRKRKIKCDRKKPCSQCVSSNASNFCFYSSPQWAVDTFLSSQKSNHLELPQESLKRNSSTTDNETSQSISHTISQVDGNSMENMMGIEHDINMIKEAFDNFAQMKKTDNVSLDSKKNYLNEIYNRIDKIKGMFEQQTESSNGDLNLLVSIDFFKHFKALEIKRSSDLSCKPLSTTSLIRKDHYLELIFQYYNARTITRKLNKNCLPGTRKKTRGAESNIAHSVLDLIKINEDKIPKANSILDKKKKDAGILKMVTNSFTCSDINIERSEEQEAEMAKEAVKNEILKVLSDIPVVYLKKYMVTFWDFVYPTLPILDRDEFETTLKRILGDVDIMSINEHDPGHEQVRITDINISLTFDFIHLAMFLVMLRFAYLVIIAQLKTHAIDRILLKKLKIPSSFLNLGNKCLGFYKPFKKSKLILLQYFILVKSYSLFSVEDGEGNDTNQGMVLRNICAILLKMIGLNRDPLNNQEIFEFCFQDKSDMQMYTVRKLFWVTVTMDHKTSSLTGLLSNFSSNFINTYTDTLFPSALVANLPKSKYNHNIEVGICDYLKSSVKVSTLFNKIIEDTSRIHNHLTLKELLKDLEQLDIALKENDCELKNMKMFDITNFTKDIEEVDYKDLHEDVLKLSLHNFKIIELNFFTLNLKVSTLHAVLVYLEDKSVMTDDLDNKKKVINLIIEMLMDNLVQLIDISHMYLNSEFKEYILKLDFHLNRLVQLAVEKTCLVMASLALKCSFAYSDNTNKEVINKRESVFYYCLLIMNEMGSLLFNSCGIKYYQGYKSLITLRFVFKLLNYYPFDSTSTAMIQFFMNFYNLFEQRVDSSDSETKGKIALLFEKNCYQRGILLPKKMHEFMANWVTLNVGNKTAFEHTQFSNCFNENDIINTVFGKFKKCKSVKNQIFKFNYRSSGKLFKGGDSDSKDTSGFATLSKKDDANKGCKQQSPLSNFTIVTEHCARNILNETPSKENNPLFMTTAAMNPSNSLSDIMDLLRDPASLNGDGKVSGQQQIPSLMGDEKIVKYLIPGLDAKMQESKLSPRNNSSMSSTDGVGFQANENNDIADGFNDAIFNYGLDVLLGENEMFPQDDMIFGPP